MEISSHYYALLALCRTCGIKKDIAYKIAYASQFVDDAKINYLFVDEPITDDPLFIKNEDDTTCIKNIATCHSYFKIKTYNFSAMMFNTCAFHFIPGCEGKTFTEKLVCKEDSKVANQIVKNNLGASPEKFGMLLHIYADTFAHQEFSGLLSKKNNIENLKPKNGTFMIMGTYYVLSSWKYIKKLLKKDSLKKLKFKDFIPAYGHGQAKHYPDIPYLKWSYNYNNESHEKAITKTLDIDNQDRFTKAFKSIQNYLLEYIKVNSLEIDSQEKETFNAFYKILINKASNKKKIEQWKKYLTSNNYYDNNSKELSYDENHWLEETFKDFNEDKYHARIVNSAQLKDNYKEESWYKFVDGVTSYKLELQDVLKEKELVLPR